MNLIFFLSRRHELQRLQAKLVIWWQTIPPFKWCLHFNEKKKFERFRRAAFVSCGFFYFGGARAQVVREMKTCGATSKLSNWLIFNCFWRAPPAPVKQHFAAETHTRPNWRWVEHNSLINQLNCLQKSRSNFSMRYLPRFVIMSMSWHAAAVSSHRIEWFPIWVHCVSGECHIYENLQRIFGAFILGSCFQLRTQ